MVQGGATELMLRDWAECCPPLLSVNCGANADITCVKDLTAWMHEDRVLETWSSWILSVAVTVTVPTTSTFGLPDKMNNMFSTLKMTSLQSETNDGAEWSKGFSSVRKSSSEVETSPGIL